MKKSFILCYLFFYSLSFFSSCEEPPYELRGADYKIIDTVFQNQIVDIKLEMDSLCELRYDKLVSDAKDSIMKVRLLEIEKKLGK